MILRPQGERVKDLMSITLKALILWMRDDAERGVKIDLIMRRNLWTYEFSALRYDQNGWGNLVPFEKRAYLAKYGPRRGRAKALG